MAIGPGKYDDVCTQAIKETNAESIILIVINGNKGSGFSMQSKSIESLIMLPDILEETAKQIRSDGKTLKSRN